MAVKKAGLRPWEGVGRIALGARNRTQTHGGTRRPRLWKALAVYLELKKFDS